MLHRVFGNAVTAAVVGLLIVLAVACGGSKGGYPKDFRSDFVSECKSSASDFAELAQSGVSKSSISSSCNCVVDKIQGHYSYDEYVKDPATTERYGLGLCLHR